MTSLTTRSARRAWTIADYASELAEGGTKTISGSEGTFWIRHEAAAMIRMPIFYSGVPTASEIRRVLWRAPAGVVSYLIEPDDSHPANAWLYLCGDQSYSLHRLSKAARRDTRRAQRSLRICRTPWSLILSHGFNAFGETRARIGLSGSTFACFQRHYAQFSRNPCHQAVAAWTEDRLVAFMPLVVVGDWVEIAGSFVTDMDRRLCAISGLADYVLEHFLVQHRFRVVSYGLSSIQDSKGPGLHHYKIKLGFQARPVHRLFVLHALVRPFANRVALLAIKCGLRLAQRNRYLRKAGGMLSTVLSEDNGMRSGT